jgi:hypothetical protein
LDLWLDSARDGDSGRVDPHGQNHHTAFIVSDDLFGPSVVAEKGLRIPVDDPKVVIERPSHDGLVECETGVRPRSSMGTAIRGTHTFQGILT